MATLIYLLLVGISFVTLVSTDDSPAQDVDHIRAVSANLYLKLRSVAFPESPYSASEVTHNRFVLMSPGKVLNYYDYYPGDEYTASVKANNMSAPESLVPPSVMEKWFDISDVVVSGDLNGGTTGKQLSVIYETILSQMTIKKFKKLYVDGEAKYNEASKYLMEPVQNPVDLAENTTRMFLYSFYQEEYAQRRLEMEEIINNAHNKHGSLEYAQWFRRNYQLLNAKVESAYAKWLVFGEKDLVELYKNFLDTTSAGAQLENARVILRSSGVSSLDRTRTIYPVSFEPSNWYEYLLPKRTHPSRDMLITKRSMLQSRRDVFNAMIKYMSAGNNGTKQAVGALKAQLNYTTAKRNKATREALKARNDCVYTNADEGMPSPKEKATTDNPCNKFRQAIQNVTSTAIEQAQASAEVFKSSFLLRSDGQYLSYWLSRIQTLDRQIEEINDQLTGSKSVYLGEIADSKEFKVLSNENVQEVNNEWMQFEYDESSSHIRTDKNKVSVKASSYFSYQSITAANHFSYGSTDFQQDLNKASLKVSGELLRVTIKRPWFRPSLFENPSLFFVQVDDDTKGSTFASPPPSSEDDLRKYINGEWSHHYLLPEYVTSFLLARNLKLEFSGLKSSSVSHALQVMVSTSFSASAKDVFSISASVGVGVEKESLTADRTATGMIITIPGVQLIGYYTQVMPEFPRGQN